MAATEIYNILRKSPIFNQNNEDLLKKVKKLPCHIALRGIEW